MATLPRIAPHLRVGNGLQVEYLSHDPAVVAALPRRRALPSLIADGGPAVLACAEQWLMPTLLLWAGQDRLADPAGS